MLRASQATVVRTHLVGGDDGKDDGAFIHQTRLDQPVDLLDTLHVLTGSHGADDTGQIDHGQVAGVRGDELDDHTLRGEVDFIFAQTLHEFVDDCAQVRNIFRCLNLFWLQGC